MKKSKILIVDDSKTFLMHITSLLDGEETIEIKTIQNPTEAVGIAKEWKADVFLTDFEMPEITGPELCKVFKEDESLRNIPIMMLTSKEGDAPLITAIHSGADDYICKSSSKEVILIKVKSMIRQRRMAQENVKAKQFEAIRSLVVTANHEFNNALTISNGALRKAKKNIDQKPIDEIEKAVECNARIRKVVEQLTNLTTFEEEDYIGGVSMLKLE